MSHSCQTYFYFPGSDLNLDCGLRNHVITRFASIGIKDRLRNKVILMLYLFFNAPLSFLVFVLFIFLFFVSASSMKKKAYISSC